MHPVVAKAPESLPPWTNHHLPAKRPPSNSLPNPFHIRCLRTLRRRHRTCRQPSYSYRRLEELIPGTGTFGWCMPHHTLFWKIPSIPFIQNQHHPPCNTTFPHKFFSINNFANTTCREFALLFGKFAHWFIPFFRLGVLVGFGGAARRAGELSTQSRSQ